MCIYDVKLAHPRSRRQTTRGGEGYEAVVSTHITEDYVATNRADALLLSAWPLSGLSCALEKTNEAVAVYAESSDLLVFAYGHIGGRRRYGQRGCCDSIAVCRAVLKSVGQHVVQRPTPLQ